MQLYCRQCSHNFKLLNYVYWPKNNNKSLFVRLDVSFGKAICIYSQKNFIPAFFATNIDSDTGMFGDLDRCLVHFHLHAACHPLEHCRTRITRHARVHGGGVAWSQSEPIRGPPGGDQSQSEPIRANPPRVHGGGCTRAWPPPEDACRLPCQLTMPGHQWPLT